MHRPIAWASGFLAGFWLLVLVAGWLNPGYLHYRFHVSALAAVGAQDAWVAMLAILCAAAAHGIVAVPLARWHLTVGALVAVAGVCLVLVAAARIPCPSGSRFCTPVAAETASGELHEILVVGYAAAMVTAMALSGVFGLTGGHPLTAGLPGLAAAVLFVTSFSGMGSAPPGLAQRTWILVGQVWLLAAGAEAQAWYRARTRDPA